VSERQVLVEESHHYQVPDRLRDQRSPVLIHPLGDAVETFVRREYAARFIEEVGATIPRLAGGLN